MPRPDARPTEHVHGEPREELVLLLNLCNLRPPTPDAACIAYSRTAGYTLGGYVVAAMAVMLKATALAPAALRAATDANLMDVATRGAGRYEVAPSTLVAGENVLAMKLVKSEPSQVVGGERLHLYTLVDQGSTLLGPGLGVFPHCRGHLRLRLYCFIVCIDLSRKMP
jgi:hypothetical protein